MTNHVKSVKPPADGKLTVTVSVPILSIVDYVMLDFTMQTDPKTLFMLYDLMISAGIAPWLDNSHDMNRLLSKTDPVEARKMKRKFRKLWRQALKAEKDAMILNSEKRFGLKLKPGVSPNRDQRRRRKELMMKIFRLLARAQVQQNP